MPWIPGLRQLGAVVRISCASASQTQKTPTPPSPMTLLHPTQHFNIKEQAQNSSLEVFFWVRRGELHLLQGNEWRSRWKLVTGWWNCGMGMMSLCTHSREGSWCGEQCRNSASVQGLTNTWCVLPQPWILLGNGFAPGGWGQFDKEMQQSGLCGRPFPCLSIPGLTTERKEGLCTAQGRDQSFYYCLVFVWESLRLAKFLLFVVIYSFHSCAKKVEIMQRHFHNEQRHYSIGSFPPAPLLFAVELRSPPNLGLAL